MLLTCINDVDSLSTPEPIHHRVSAASRRGCSTPLFYGAVVALCLTWILAGLIGHEPWKADGVYTFGMIYHVLNTGDWVVPTVAEAPFMEKPPLYVISGALFAKLLSPPLASYDAARLASGFWLALAMLFVGLAAKELSGRGRGWFAVVVLLGCLGLPENAHKLVTDTAQLSGFAMACYGLALSLRRATLGGLWLGTGAGIGFLAKGLLAPGVIGLAALLLPVLSADWRRRDYQRCLLTALLAAIPWLLIWPTALYWRSPALFMEWFWNNNLGRYFDFNVLGPKQAPGFYFVTLLWYAFPALLLALWTLGRQSGAGNGGRFFDLPAALMAALTVLLWWWLEQGGKFYALPLCAWLLWRSGFGPGWNQPSLQLPLIVFAATLAVLSIASDAREIYTMPLLLPLALLAAAAVDTLPAALARLLNGFGIVLVGAAAAALWVGWVALLTGQPAVLAGNFAACLPGFQASFDIVAFAPALILTVIWIVMATGRRPSGERFVLNWGVGATLVWTLLMTLWLPFQDALKSHRPMMASLQQAMPAGYRCIAGIHMDETRRALFHYLGGIIVYDGWNHGRHQECDLLVVVRRDQKLVPGGWRLLWEGGKADDHNHYLLYQQAGSG